MYISDITATAVALFLLYALIKRQKRTQKLPPGPKGLPLLGNLREWPREKPWLTFTAWGQQYGKLKFMLFNFTELTAAT